MSRPRRLAIAAGAVAALLLADTVVWWVATGRLLAAFAGWQTSLGPHGWQATADPPVASGWPLAATLRLHHARLCQVAKEGPAWAAEDVQLGVSLLRPHALTVVPSGAQSLTIPGWTTIRFKAAGMLAIVPLGAPIEAARAEATRLALETPAGEAVAQAVRLDAGWTAGAVHLQVVGGPIALPAGRHWGLGQTVTTAAIELVAHGPWPAGGGRAAAERWRDAGGSIDITHVAGQWGTLDAHGSGAVRLDADAQPAGQLALTVIDPQSAIAMLAQTGAISHGTAIAAGAVLGLMLLPQRLGGGPATVDLPLRLDGGVIFVGQIPIARAPLLRWP